MEKGLRGCFTIPFFVAFENLITAMTHTVYIVTRPENFDILREKTHQIPVATVEEAWELAKKQLAEEGKTDLSHQHHPPRQCHCAVPEKIRDNP